MIEVQLFEGFRITVDGREQPMAFSAKETLALLMVAGGKRVTAKALWKVLYDYKKVKYSSLLYTRRIKDLESELETLGLSEILYSGTRNVRFCRIIQDAFICDYFEMLNGRRPMGTNEDFLPEYEWAKNFYCKDWNSLYLHWDDLKC